MSIVETAKGAVQGAMQTAMAKLVPFAPDSWIPGGLPDPLIRRKNGLIGTPVSRLDGSFKVRGGLAAVSASEHLLRRFVSHGGSRVLMAGSCAEYDWSRVEVCDELLSPLADHGTAPMSPYAACKIGLQKTLADVGRREHLSTAWGRIFFQFGPYEHPDRLVPFVICNLLQGRAAPCSHGRQVRSFLHVADVGAAFAAVLDSALEGPVNIGSDEPVALADLVERIGRQIGRQELVQLGARPAAAHEPPVLVPDVRRLRVEAEWRPRFTLNEALSDTVAWWRRTLADSAGAH